MFVSSEVEYLNDLESMIRYCKYNFYPPLPESIAELSYRAVNYLEAGAFLQDIVVCYDMDCIPFDADVFDDHWTIEIGDLIVMMYLQESLSDKTLERVSYCDIS